mgnify:CR=1 FL=1
MERPEMSRFTLRLSQELLDKLGYIAEYNARTKNKELERYRIAGVTGSMLIKLAKC